MSNSGRLYDDKKTALGKGIQNLRMGIDNAAYSTKQGAKSVSQMVDKKLESTAVGRSVKWHGNQAGKMVKAVAGGAKDGLKQGVKVQLGMKEDE